MWSKSAAPSHSVTNKLNKIKPPRFPIKRKKLETIQLSCVSASPPHEPFDRLNPAVIMRFSNLLRYVPAVSSPYAFLRSTIISADEGLAPTIEVIRMNIIHTKFHGRCKNHL